MRVCIGILSIIVAIEASSSHNQFHKGHNRYPLAFSSSLPSDIAQSARDELFTYSQQINKESKTGVLITDKEIKQKLNKLTAELEAVCDNPTAKSQELMVGDWKLLCSIAQPSQDIMGGADMDTKQTKSKGKGKGKGVFGLPSFFPTPNEIFQNVNELVDLNPIQKSIRDSVDVVQRIRAISDNDDYPSMVEGIDTFNRIDNVIEFKPSPITTFLEENKPDAISNLDVNFNPLEVSKSKVTLAHTAKVQSISPLLRTKMALKSVILNVAGTSQYLEVDGEDVLGLNVPLGDLLNFGSFDTTYVDDEMRVSRGKVGLVDQLRVFVRMTDDTEDIEDATIVEDETIAEIVETETMDESKEDEDEIGESTDEIVDDEMETDVDDETKEEEEEKEDEEVENEEITDAEIVSEEDNESEEKVDDDDK